MIDITKCSECGDTYNNPHVCTLNDQKLDKLKEIALHFPSFRVKADIEWLVNQVKLLREERSNLLKEIHAGEDEIVRISVQSIKRAQEIERLRVEVLAAERQLNAGAPQPQDWEITREKLQSSVKLAAESRNRVAQQRDEFAKWAIKTGCSCHRFSDGFTEVEHVEDCILQKAKKVLGIEQ